MRIKIHKFIKVSTQRRKSGTSKKWWTDQGIRKRQYSLQLQCCQFTSVCGSWKNCGFVSATNAAFRWIAVPAGSGLIIATV
jgi:hypothetical protein